MNDFIEIKEKLGDIDVDLPFKLPRIVVVGAESAGKSSVLERLANFRFFPRGRGLTTRMPILLSLKKKTVAELREISSKNGLTFRHLLKS
jgi:GTP-binding protein EngB required for normal cell division